MIYQLILLLSLLLLQNQLIQSYIIKSNNIRNFKYHAIKNNIDTINIKKFISIFTSIAIINSIYPYTINAKSDLPPLDKCFNAIRKELDGTSETKSFIRLKDDLTNDNWSDIIAFTREFDAGFRGGVLKSAWKQLEGEKKDKGIELSNSFTYDLIALNKAAREKRKDDAIILLQQVKQDLVKFLDLESTN